MTASKPYIDPYPREWESIMESCAECGKPIMPNEGAYRTFEPLRIYHSGCGDPLGIKSAFATKDSEIASLRAELAASMRRHD